MTSTNINYALVERSLSFHGIPMQKVWEGEHGDQDLARASVTPDFGIYQSRQKGFEFGDRAKRLKLHQFIAKKANVFFKHQFNVASASRPADFEEGILSDVLPYNCYLSEKHDKTAQLQHIYKLLHVGDIVYAEITNRTTVGLFAKVLCSRPPNFHYLHDLKAQAFVSNAELVPVLDRRGSPRSYVTGDLIMCEILEVSADNERMILGMRGVHGKAPLNNGQSTFGVIGLDQFPALYKEHKTTKKTYNERLGSSFEFKNPYIIEVLASGVGLDFSITYSNMSGSGGGQPALDQTDYCAELRQQQASKWAFRSVAEGIEHFKEGRQSEAFQCLNKALNVDPRNVEGLVARGALYANSGSFKKAVEDFETALKLNANHANARKYMGHTLVALGRNYEEENNLEEAKNAYQACLNIIPTHEEARNSLEFLWAKNTGKNLIEPQELSLPALNLKISEQKRGLLDIGRSESKKDSGNASRVSKKSKKKKSKNRKRDTSSSSSSSSSSSDSSSDSDSDSSSSSDSDYSKSKKKHRSRAAQPKQRSLSPLSKRMASMVNESNVSGSARPIMPAATYAFDQAFPYNPPDDYEMKVRKFLELTREEKAGSAKKKKEHKKRKSAHRDSKKKKKEKRMGKSSKRDKYNDDKVLNEVDNMELREALKIIKSLPGLDMSAKLLGMEKSLQLQQKDGKKEEENKWKMNFNKDKSSASNNLPNKIQGKQYAFDNDEEEATIVGDVDNDLFLSASQVGASISSASATGSKLNDNIAAMPVTYPKYGARQAAIAAAAQIFPGTAGKTGHTAAAPSAAGQQTTNIPPSVVLDKFGSFRLADAGNNAAGAAKTAVEAPAGGLANTQRRASPVSRTRSRSVDSGAHKERGRRKRRHSRRHSESRSGTRSPRRRSGSRQYRRRQATSRSRSRSRSTHDGDRSRSRSRQTYSHSRSRSRSRSVSGERRYSGNGGRGGRGYYRGNGGTYYKPHFNNFRGNQPMHHYNNRGGQMNYRGGYNNYNPNYHHNRGGYVNNRGYQHGNYHHYNNNGNYRGRWINRGGGGGHYRQYDNDPGRLRGRNARDSRSSSYTEENNGDDHDGEPDKDKPRYNDRHDRRRGRSSSRDDDDEDEEGRVLTSRENSRRSSVSKDRVTASKETAAADNAN